MTACCSLREITFHRRLDNPLSTIFTPLSMLPPSSLGWQPPPPSVPTPILYKIHVHSRFSAKLSCLTAQFFRLQTFKASPSSSSPNLLLITFPDEVLIPRPCMGHETNAWYRGVGNSSPVYVTRSMHGRKSCYLLPFFAGVCQLNLLWARVDQVRYGGAMLQYILL